MFKTDPSSGDLAEGKPFTLYVSDGPTPSELPPLIGQPVDEVAAALTKLQLTLVISGPQFSETLPANTITAFTVAGQVVPEGASVDKGSTVEVFVSAGPEPRTIPPLANLPPDQVEATLKSLGLVASRGEDVFDNVVPAGPRGHQHPTTRHPGPTGLDGRLPGVEGSRPGRRAVHEPLHAAAGHGCLGRRGAHRRADRRRPHACPSWRPRRRPARPS